MATQVQFRRGTATQIAAFTGAAGEITPDMTNKRLVLHDGVTAGGRAQATEAFVTAAIAAQPIGTHLYNVLGSDVNLSNTSNYFDGPSISQGTSGMWLVIGKVSVRDLTIAASFLIKLWDGTTVIDSATVTAAQSQYASCTLCGIASSPAGNLRVSVCDLSSTSGVIRANGSLLGRDCSITAVRLA